MLFGSLRRESKNTASRRTNNIEQKKSVDNRKEKKTVKEPTIMGFGILDFFCLMAIGIPLVIVTSPIWITLLLCGVDIKRWIMEED